MSILSIDWLEIGQRLVRRLENPLVALKSLEGAPNDRGIEGGVRVAIGVKGADKLLPFGASLVAIDIKKMDPTDLAKVQI